ncbi:MAG: transposase [Albidovulum sp.]|nr:transposase [Albidovulum sp.]
MSRDSLTNWMPESAWFRPVFGDRGEIDFPFLVDRGNGAVPDLLGDFEGALLSDGDRACAAYAESRNGAVAHAGCRARARREFEKAKDSEPRLAAEALELIGALQLCERKIRKRKLEGAGKLEFRRTRALPAANAFRDWSAGCGFCRSAGRTGSSAGRRSERRRTGSSRALSRPAGCGAANRAPATRTCSSGSRSTRRRACRSPRRGGGRICSLAIR